MIRLLGFVSGTLFSAVALLALVDGTRAPGQPGAVAPSAPAMIRLPHEETRVAQTEPATEVSGTTASGSDMPLATTPVGSPEAAVRPDANPPVDGENPASREARQGGAAIDSPASAAAPDRPTQTGDQSARESHEGSDAASVATCRGAECAESGAWAMLWRPFLSELSARGFATGLARATGLDYRVMPTGDGRFQVAFAYDTEEQRRTRLARIESATGLRLAETQP